MPDQLQMTTSICVSAGARARSVVEGENSSALPAARTRYDQKIEAAKTISATPTAMRVVVCISVLERPFWNTTTSDPNAPLIGIDEATEVLQVWSFTGAELPVGSWLNSWPQGERKCAAGFPKRIA